MDPDSGASEAEKPAESDRRKRREMRKHKTMGERGRLVISIFEVLMLTGREEAAVEGEAWCIMGSPPLV